MQPSLWQQNLLDERRRKHPVQPLEPCVGLSFSLCRMAVCAKRILHGLVKGRPTRDAQHTLLGWLTSPAPMSLFDPAFLDIPADNRT